MMVYMEKIQLGELSGFRTNSISGFCELIPEVGKPFVIIGESLTECANMRVVRTSRVVDIQGEGQGEFIIITESGSKYKVQILEDEKVEDFNGTNK